MLFQEAAFLDRFDLARRAGFAAVECQFPYAEALPDLAAARGSLHMALFNLPAGDWPAGERGLAALPDRRGEFRAGVEQAVAYASALGWTRLNCLAGVVPEEVGRAEAEAVLCENLRYAADVLARRGMTLLVEPINPFDAPGFFLTTARAAAAAMERAGRPNIRLQYDAYHLQRSQGELANTFLQFRDRIGHVQIADAPSRREPGTGEIHFPYLLRVIERSGYDGHIGLEYAPAGGTLESLHWLSEWRAH